MGKQLTGITIQKSKISHAFALISFMVGELIFENSIEAPVNIENYAGLDSEHFRSLRIKMMHDLNTKNEVVLNIEESILLYLIVDMVCKCFVSETNIVLKEQAQQQMNIDEKEYSQVRLSYLHFAQSLLEEMNTKFGEVPEFEVVIDKLRHWRL